MVEDIAKRQMVTLIFKSCMMFSNKFKNILQMSNSCKKKK